MRKGFTLVELAISLTIIGLLVAGIAGGSVLIQQAQARRVIVALLDAESAFNGFIAVYDAVPGDMSNASDIWPSCGVDNASCNGNGNGNLDTTYDATDETLRILKHLSLEGLLNAGVPQLTGVYTQPLPYSPRLGSLLGYNYLQTTFTDPSVGKTFQLFANQNPYPIMVAVGTPRSSGVFGFAGFYNNSAFTPAEAYAIDHKIDDGNFNGTNYVGNNTGKLWAIFGGDRADVGELTDCISWDEVALVDPGSYYVMTNPNKACVLSYLIRQ
ncbi:MAG: type II secretion system protein [Gammaproteobacteria bacterium]